ncbi:MAG: Asp-tRNA(Asn)/Glu-tRNA(Gln) amidotransferase subunit GatB [Patescibacteria group bacterium]
MKQIIETIIGLEVHVQLKTKSKMFCGCDNRGEYLPPNTCVCETCLGYPGTLPVPNRQAIEWALKTAMALHCEILEEFKFDRKHYFYPDLPKGYQISQYDQPLSRNGFLEIEIKEGGVKKIGITRLHLEEDTAKLLHSDDGSTLVDFNRAGTPLMEIVSEPDIRTPQEAKAYLQELRSIVRALKVSDADMEKGHLRCDANISVRRFTQIDTQIHADSVEKLNTKIEIKNLNSFRAVERALAYEEKRLVELLEQGEYPTVQETRGWDDAKGVTVLQRSKEEAEDYRYFPEPDIPPFRMSKEEVGDIRAKIPELPREKRQRFVTHYRFSAADARIIVADEHLADFTEKVISELLAWLVSLPGELDEAEVWEKYGDKLSKLTVGWLTSKLGGVLAARGETYESLKVTPEDFAEFLTLIYGHTISSTIAQELLAKMVETGEDPHTLLETLGGGQIKDTETLGKAVDEVINANPKIVADFKGGKDAVMMYLVGQVMKEMKGRADPQLVQSLLREKLS